MAREGVVSISYLVNSDSFNSKIGDMKKNLQLMQTQVKNSAKEIDVYGTNIQTLSKKQDSINQAIKQTEKIMNSYNQQLEKNKTALSKNQSELDSLAAKKKELNSQYKQAVKMYGQESEEAQKLKEQLSQTASEYDKMKGKVESNKSNIQNYTTQLERQRTTLLDLQGQLKQTNEEIEKQGNKFTEASQKFADYSGKLEKAGVKLEEIGEVAMTAGTAILTAATGLATMSIEMDSQLSVISGRLGLTTEQSEELKEAALRLYENGFGESLPDCIDDVVLLQQVLGDTTNITGEERDRLLEYIETIKSLFGADTQELLRTANNMVKTGLVGSFEEAMNVITVGYQQNLNYQGDFLDTLNEYSSQYTQLGFDVQDVLAMLSKGVEAGAFNTDKLADSVKEFGLRVREGSDDTKEAFNSMGLDAGDMLNKFSQGGDAAKNAFYDTLDAISKIEDPIKRNKVGVALMGTQWEDVGEKAILAMKDARNATIDVTDATAKAGQEINNSMGTKIETVMRRLKDSLADMGKSLLPAVEAVTEGIEDLTKFISKLNPEVVKSVAKFGAMALAFGAVTKATGSLVTGISKGASGLLKFMSAMDKIKSLGGFAKALGAATSSTGGLVSALGTLSSVALPLAAVIGAVAGGVYLFKKHNDVLNQSVTKSREEMTTLEKVLADLSGTTTYSKDELKKMGLVYDDFNKNISKDFQKAVEDMTTDIHDFGMDLNDISLDGVIDDNEVNDLTERVSGALESCNKAIEEKGSTLQSGLEKAFSMDGVIDESEQSLLEYWNGRTTKEKEEAQKCQDEINAIIATARAEGRGLTPEEEEQIRQYYARIKQIELECQASNSYEIEYAQKDFQNRINTADAKTSQELLGKRYKDYKEQQIATKNNYDTLIAMAMEGYDGMSEADKQAALDTKARLEKARDEELAINQQKYDEDIRYAEEHCENLGMVFNKYTGQRVAANDVANYQEYEQMREHYEGIGEITESGYKRVFDTATGTWKDLYVSVDEATGQLKGVYDLNTQNVATMTEGDESALRDEVAAWQGSSEGILANCITMGTAYADLSGNIRDESGNIIGHIEQITDENGNLIDTIVDINGNPIKIGDNSADVIKKLKETGTEVNKLDGKKATVTVQYVAKGLDAINYHYERGVAVPNRETGGTVNESGVYNTQEAGLELIDTASPSQTAYSLANAARGELTYIPANSKVTNAAMTTLKMKNMVDEQVKSTVDLYMAGFEKKLLAVMKGNNGNGDFNVTMHNVHFENKESEQQNISNIKRIVKSMK